MSNEKKLYRVKLTSNNILIKFILNKLEGKLFDYYDHTFIVTEDNLPQVKNLLDSYNFNYSTEEVEGEYVRP